MHLSKFSDLTYYILLCYYATIHTKARYSSGSPMRITGTTTNKYSNMSAMHMYFYDIVIKLSTSYCIYILCIFLAENELIFGQKIAAY